MSQSDDTPNLDLLRRELAVIVRRELYAALWVFSKVVTGGLIVGVLLAKY